MAEILAESSCWKNRNSALWEIPRTLFSPKINWKSQRSKLSAEWHYQVYCLSIWKKRLADLSVPCHSFLTNKPSIKTSGHFCAAIPRATPRCIKQVQHCRQHQMALQKTQCSQSSPSRHTWSDGDSFPIRLSSAICVRWKYVYIVSTFSFHCRYLSHSLCVFQCKGS